MNDDTPAFNDAWLKWGWATAYGEVLKAEAQEAFDEIKGNGQVTATARYYPKRHCFIIAAEKVPSLPARLSLILGDVVQGYRSALDHVAWELVHRGSARKLSPKAENLVGFPIAYDGPWFNKKLATMLPGVGRAEIAKVRRYQPYLRGHRNRHPLTVLQKLSNDDKHRNIQPVLVVPAAYRFEVTEVRDCVVTKIPRRGKLLPLEVGAEMARMYVRKTGPDPHAEMKGDVAVQPVIGEFIPLSDWLQGTTQIVGGILRQFAQPPDGLIETIAPQGSEHVFP
jgi:hypothetical protein